MANIDIQVPDIGDFDEVAVIELLVKVGDTVAVDQSLITVESDKASMEIPSSHAGVVTALKVMLGDKVKQGSVVLTMEATSAPSLAVTSEPRDYDLIVLGGGPGGYSAAFRAADLGLKVAIVERYAQLGGVCLNVGCIPSKALLHVAAVMDEVSHLADMGVDYGKPKLNIDNLRGHKEKVIGKLTGGLAAMAKMRKVTVLRGYGVFVDSHHLSVEETTGTAQDKTGQTQVVSFKTCIIAAGSQAVHLPFMPDDPRVVDSTGALQLAKVPKRMLVLGGGIIGLEMGTVYSTLGARLDVVEMM
ncbi:MAG: FAD-dependent oxidoreductase, partial [Betaproteobacteria bacterium]|nr:FAD-dependent oxidoreductase [Betaproteobacteria bacterium]